MGFTLEVICRGLLLLATVVTLIHNTQKQIYKMGDIQIAYYSFLTLLRSTLQGERHQQPFFYLKTMEVNLKKPRNRGKDLNEHCLNTVFNLMQDHH